MLPPSEPSMRVLAVDTATLQASVAVSDRARVLVQSDRQVTTHSEGLLDLIDQTLAAARTTVGELDALVCGRGPGSFTGLRIGMATVKGLCLAANKPLVCLSSMIGVAAAVCDRLGPQHCVAVVLDARRDQVYYGLYRGTRLLQPEQVLSPQAVTPLLPPDEPLVLAGDGALRYREQHWPDRELAPDDLHAIQAGYLALAARARIAAGDFDDLRAAVPSYLRGADARMPR